MSKPRPNGFALLTVLWLLLLAGAIVSLLLLMSLERAKGQRREIDRLQEQLAIESVIDTIIADRQFNGRASRWWQLSQTGQVKIDGVDVALSLNAATARVDVNRAGREALQSEALKAGLSRSQAAAFANSVLRRRQAGDIADIAQLLGPGVNIDQLGCIEQHFTVTGGRTRPGDEGMTASLSQTAQSSLIIEARAGSAVRTVRVGVDGRLTQYRPFSTRCDTAD